MVLYHYSLTTTDKTVGSPVDSKRKYIKQTKTRELKRYICCFALLVSICNSLISILWEWKQVLLVNYVNAFENPTIWQGFPKSFYIYCVCRSERLTFSSNNIKRSGQRTEGSFSCRFRKSPQEVSVKTVVSTWDENFRQPPSCLKQFQGCLFMSV